MKPKAPDNLDELVEGCVKGKRECQNKIYQMHYGKMLGVCRRYARDSDEARDIMQDGFIKVFANIGQYNGEGSFEGWIRRIMVNTAIDYFRKNKSYLISIDSEEGPEIADERADEEDDSIYGNVKTADVLREVQNLSPAYKAVFNLYVMEGYSHQQIADELGISIGTSKSNLAKAKVNLKKALSRLIEEYNEH